MHCWLFQVTKSVAELTRSVNAMAEVDQAGRRICKQRCPKADNKQRTRLRHSVRKYGLPARARRRESAWTRGHCASQVTSRVPRMLGGRLECSIQGLRCRSNAQAAEADGICSEGETPLPNATILEEDDRAASAQLHLMMLMICKGAALNIVFLAGQ